MAPGAGWWPQLRQGAWAARWVRAGTQDDGEGDLVGVDAQVDGGGHGLVDQGVVDGKEAPDLLLGKVWGLSAQPPVAAPQGRLMIL